MSIIVVNFGKNSKEHKFMGGVDFGSKDGDKTVILPTVKSSSFDVQPKIDLPESRYSTITDRTQLLSICCSKDRPSRFKEMADSFFDTKSENTELIVYIDAGDPSVEKYKQILVDDGRINYEIGPYKTLIEVDNYFALKYPNIKFKQEIHDDMIYRTPEWDKILTGKLIENGGCGIAHGQSLCNEFPSAFIMSQNIISALGYFIYPKFVHLGHNLFIQDLGILLQKIWSVPEVTIEHMHTHLGKGPSDDNYEINYNANSDMLSKKTYADWKSNHRMSDVHKIIDYIKSKNIKNNYYNQSKNNYRGQSIKTGGGSVDPIDKIINDRYFKNEQNGYFMEAGANDGLFLSTCKVFEDMGWKGINIEPSKTLFNKLIVNRPNSININVALSDNNEMVDFEESDFDNGGFNRIKSTRDEKTDKLFGIVINNSYKIQTTTYDQIVKELKIPNMDLFVLDVENHELNVIRGMTTILPTILCIEHTHVGLETLKGVLPNYNLDWNDSLNAIFVRK